MTLLLFCFSRCTKPGTDDTETERTILGTVHLPTQESVDSFVTANRPYQRIVIQGGVVIGRPNTNVRDISQLSKIRSILVELVIRDTKELSSLNGLQHITSLNSLSITGNKGLSNLRGLDSLRSVHNDVIIDVNSGLASLDGLGALEVIGGSLKFFNGLLGGTMPYNTDLKTINLPRLRKIGGELNLANSYVVTSFSFPQLDSIGADLTIAEAAMLPEFTGFERLRFIGGRLYMWSNQLIRNLRGFNALAETGGEILIDGNRSLVSLQGLEALRKTKVVIISFNPELANLCALKPLIQNMMVLNPGTSLTPFFSLSGNASSLPDPTSYEYVLNNCP
jgi:hypothetical protein